MKPVKATLGLLVVLAAAAGGLYLTEILVESPRASVDLPQRQAEKMTVETALVKTATFSDTVRAVGTARARVAVDLVAESTGRIVNINFTPGQQVSKGDVLLQLDARAEDAGLKAAEATLTEAKAAFERQQLLNEAGNASDAVFQTARAALLRAEAEYEQAELQLDDRQLRAPFTGIVGLSDLVVGQIAEPSTVVTTLDDLSVVEVAFSVSETVLPRLRAGQRIEVTTAAWPGRVFEGEISQVDTRVESATRSIAVRAEIPNDDRALTGGMFLQVRLVLEERQQLSIPERVLSVDGERELVLIVEGGLVKEAEIQTGKQIDGLVEVVSGLAPDAQIIMTNLQRVNPGMAVEVVPHTPEQQASVVSEAGK